MSVVRRRLDGRVRVESRPYTGLRPTKQDRNEPVRKKKTIENERATEKFMTPSDRHK